MRLRHAVLDVVRGLWKPGDRVAVGCSGGADSVALAHLLHRTAGAHGGSLCLATFDHGVRAESALDVEFVQKLGGELALDVVSGSAMLGAGASEAACREARFAFFESLEVEWVVLGHHADDLAETVLLSLMRGAGTRGLGSLQVRRGRYLRPLLGFRRDQLRAWLVQKQLAWREDESNNSDAYARNRLRHEVLPLLENIRAGATDGLARTAEVCAEESAWLDDLAEGAPGPPWPLQWVQTERRAFVRRVLAAHVEGAEARHFAALFRLSVASDQRVGPFEVRAGAVHPLYAGDLGVRFGCGAVCPRSTEEIPE